MKQLAKAGYSTLPANDNSRHLAPGNDLSLKDRLYHAAEKEVAKIAPPLYEVQQKIARDISDAVYSSSLDYGSRSEIMGSFEQAYLRQKVVDVKGNLTEVVRQAYGADDPAKVNNLRRNVYRKLDLGFVDSQRPWKPEPKQQLGYSSPVSADTIESAVMSSLDNYREVLHPSVYKSVSEKISQCSTDIADTLGHYVPTKENLVKGWVASTKDMTLPDAMKRVESEIIYSALEAADFNKERAAKYLGDSLRTLNRRIKGLGLKKEIEKKKDPEPVNLQSSKDDIDRLKEIMLERESKDQDSRTGEVYFIELAADYADTLDDNDIVDKEPDELDFGLVA